MEGLSPEESAIVETVHDFVQREVKPAVRELEHDNIYPERLIEQMKSLGIFGLAVPEPWGGSVRDAMRWSPKNLRAAG
jgi:alkylation response protein AidB-like acyl-CoA dehydrogenase